MTILEQALRVVETHEAQSSAISSAGYCPELQAMAIMFANNRKHIYLYKNVSPELFADYQKAESKGTWFQSNLRGNAAHPYVRLELTGVTR